jgi:RimJ/RimL family protein N-acetyltransferase
MNNLLDASDVILRDVEDSDLPIFFEQQLDPEANFMAAFTAKDPTDRVAFEAHWRKIRNDPTITIKTIVVNDLVVGHVSTFEMFGERDVSYWIGREDWGKGIASRALAKFLKEVPVRPLYGRAASDNLASIRVMQKCGFTVLREERGFANARGAEIDETVLLLT